MKSEAWTAGMTNVSEAKTSSGLFIQKPCLGPNRFQILILFLILEYLHTCYGIVKVEIKTLNMNGLCFTHSVF